MIRTKQIFIYVLILTLISFSNSWSQKPKKESKKSKAPVSSVFAKVGKEEITSNTLEQAYQKNTNRKSTLMSDMPKDSLMDFLKLYINYRLKVNDAIGRGFENDSSVKADISQNRKLLAESFYYDKKLVEPNVKSMSELRKHELMFAYILIVFDGRNNPNDTGSAFMKATEALTKLKAGADWGAICKEYSDDKEAATRGGVVEQWVTGGQLLRTLDNALSSIPSEGQIYGEIVKTKNGYFILKLVKRQERIAILPSHILINEGLDIDSAKVAARADSIVNLLRKGYSFTRLAEENSDDPATAPRGGKMGAYYSRSTKFEGSGKQISPLLENELFRLKDGEFSDKILSEFGYHILRRDSTKNYDETKEKEEVKKIYKRLYYEEDKQTLLNELKDQYGFKLNNPVLDEFLSKVDTTKTNLDSAWLKNVPADIYKKDLYSMGTKSTSLGDFVEKFDNAPDMRGLATSREGITRAINKQITPVIFDEATKNLEKEYPDFAALMREFHDGILLFKAEAMEVWDKLKFDSVLAHAYYDSTKTKYWTEPVYNLTEVYLLSDSTANDVYKKAMAGENLEDLAANNTQRSGYREKKGKWEKINPKNSKLAMLVKENNGQTGQILKPLPFEKGFSVIKVDLVEPSRPKTFEEAIPDFAPILQDQVQKRLTEQWLAKIKEKYPVTIYDKNIDSYLKKGKKGK